MNSYLDHPNKLVVGAIIVSLIFIIVGHFYRDQIQSRLKQPLMHVKEFDLDWWSVTHFMLFAFFGFVKPGYPLSFFTIGALFEVFEDGCASDANTQLVDCVGGNKSGLACGVMCNGFSDSYWYGKFDDIFANLLGYVVGQALRYAFGPPVSANGVF